KDDDLERATEVTTRLMEHKKESTIVRMAKRKIDEVKGAVEDRKIELKIDEDEEIAEELSQEVEDKAEQKVIEEAKKIKDREAKLKAKAKSRPAMKVKLSTKDLPVGALAIAYASGEQRLVKILANRVVRQDPEPWVKVQLYGSNDIQGVDDRAYNPEWLLNGAGVKQRSHRVMDSPGSSC